MSMSTSLFKPLLSKVHFGQKSFDQPHQFRTNYQPNGYQVRWTLKRWEKTAHERFDPRGLATSRISKNILENYKDPIFKENMKQYKTITAHSGNGKIRAICLLHTPPGESTAHISQLVSAPSRKAKGAGKTAMFAAQQYAKKAGYQNISLMPYNSRVDQFYKAHGYKPASKDGKKSGLLMLDLHA